MSYQDYKELLAEFISFKSISTDSQYQPEIQKTVAWLTDLFKDAGFTVENWKGSSSNPVVYASYTVDKDAETVLVYGHYDVQPALKSDGWDAEPFTLVEKKDRLIARGIVDNKGQVLIHAYTVIELAKAGKLKYNVVFLIEGNEETSNEDLAGLIKKNKSKLKVDHILISDGEIASWKPVVEYSLRGGFSCKLVYKTANNNLHSGLYGGAVPNPVHELSKFIAGLYDGNKVAMGWFYDNVDEITPAQRKNNKKAVEDLKEMMDHVGVKKLLTEDKNDFMTQVGLRPTIQVTGIKSGYIGEGFSNIVPSDAEVRFNFRTVMSQDYNVLVKKFEQHIKKNTPSYVEYEVKFATTYDPIKINVDTPMVKETVKLLEKAFGEEVLVKPVGGGIPVVNDFKEQLGIEAMLVSLGNEDCNMHGVNENFHVGICKKGLKFSELFFSK